MVEKIPQVRKECKINGISSVIISISFVPLTEQKIQTTVEIQRFPGIVSSNDLIMEIKLRY